MSDPYDLVVIGSGTGAQTATGHVRSAGWRVAVIDHRPFGGTCALRGCDPKKMLVSGEEAIDANVRMKGRGVDGELRIDWSALMAFKRTFTDPIPAKQERRYAEMGVDAFHGQARFLDPETIEVAGSRLTAKHILIATGAQPASLNVSGEDLIASSDDFLELEKLPARIVLIGGGYIAAEFSHLAARAGAQVAIIQRGSRLLPHFDPDVVEWLMPRFTELGVSVHAGATVTRVERDADALLVRAICQDGSESILSGDLVVHAAGRVPALHDLDLEAGQVAVEDGRLRLDDHLRSTSSSRVYAVGAAAGVGPPLTPVSSHDAKIVAADLLGGGGQKPDYRGVPSVAFTVPPIAAVGLSEHEAREKGLSYRVNAASTPEWFTARRLNEIVYGHKVLIDKATGHSATPAVQRAVVTVDGQAAEPEDDEEDGTKPLPERLVIEVTAHRTLALRNAVAEHPDVAMTLLPHKLVSDTFRHTAPTGCLEANVRHIFFSARSEELKDSAATQDIAERHARWGDHVPADDQALWDWLILLDPDTRLDLLAHCVSYGVNALFEQPNQYGSGVSQHGLDVRLSQADRLARATGATWWRQAGDRRSATISATSPNPASSKPSGRAPANGPPSSSTI